MDTEGAGRDSVRLVIAAAVLSLGIFLGAATFGLFFHASRAQHDEVQVTGAATRPFVSDIAKWRIVLSRQVTPTGITQGYRDIGTDLDRLRERLVSAGIPADSIGVSPVNAQPMWGRDGERTGYNLQQGVTVISDAPETIESLALNPGALLESGAFIESSQLEYFYSGIAELKHSLLAEATADARRRAEEIVSGDASLGRLVQARAGVFQITEPYSTEVAAYGVHSTATRRKEITVTVHATFRMD